MLWSKPTSAAGQSRKPIGALALTRVRSTGRRIRWRMLGTTDIGSDCISISENFNTFRVRVPLQGVDTTFGAALGFTEIDVCAAAEAKEIPTGAVAATSRGCALSTSGGFDHVHQDGPRPVRRQRVRPPARATSGPISPIFTQRLPVTWRRSGISGEQKAPLARSMADGIDHEFSVYNPLGTQLLEETGSGA